MYLVQGNLTELYQYIRISVKCDKTVRTSRAFLQSYAAQRPKY